MLQKKLARDGIGTGLHYPIPLHLQKAYAGYDFAEGDYPESEVASREILSLPMFPGLTEEQQDLVVNAIRSFPFFRRADSNEDLEGEAVSQVLSRDPAGAVPQSADWSGKGIPS